MILSHKHKFIFLKTNKTAGTSVEIALSRFCGNNDVITPIDPEDEKTRHDLGYPGPRNYLAPLWDYGPRDVVDAVRHRTGKRRFFNHMTAREVRGLVGDRIWNDYYKFCFERNPWDRVISLYYWRNKTEPRPAIRDFVASEAPLLLKRKGFDVYTIEGDVAVDRVGLFEQLAEHLEEIRTRLGLPEPLMLPRAKTSFRTDKRQYRELLDEKSRKRIETLFREEIAWFGYRF